MYVGVDYKELMSGHDPLGVLGPALTDSNVHVLAGLAGKIPCGGDKHLSGSQVYKCFVEGLFWPGGSGISGGEVDWDQRYEACHECMARMDLCDVVDFAKSVTVSERALQVCLDCIESIENAHMHTHTYARINTYTPHTHTHTHAHTHTHTHAHTHTHKKKKKKHTHILLYYMCCTFWFSFLQFLQIPRSSRIGILQRCVKLAHRQVSSKEPTSEAIE